MVKLFANCIKYAGLTLLINILLTQDANGDAICNKLKYGSVQNHYMLKLDKFCCLGYERIDDDCLPRCELGCPPNSHCVLPNVCGCDLGYEIDEVNTYYGRELIKSCRFERGVIVLIIIILTVIVIGIAIYVYVKCFRRRQKTSAPVLMNVLHQTE